MYPAKPGLLFGFHGCDRAVRDSIVNQQSMLKSSDKDYNWLGTGMYFWENDPERALHFAQELHHRPQKGKDPIDDPAVLGAVIDLGLCLDLLEKKYIELVRQSRGNLEKIYELLGLDLPKNQGVGGSIDLLIRKLDNAVIENLHSLQKKNKQRPFDSVRGFFTEGAILYPTAGFYEKSHIQLCIRNPNCIKGFFIPREEDTKWIVP